jgi:iron-siderophore transport system substrate-binding protein
VQLTRRQFAGLALGVGGLGLTACGRSDKSSDKGSSTAGFPVTLTHRFGHTTIPRKPKRVVAVGGGDMETAIALGIVPVAGADWFGWTTPREWVTSALNGAKQPELFATVQLPYEKIAAANPDLILYVNSLNDQSVFNKLKEIAPTVAGPSSVKNAYGVHWQDQVSIIAKATGNVAKGRTLVAETNDLLAKARKANPQFVGKTVTAGVFSSGAVSVWFPSDPRMRILQSLGFVPNKAISKLDNGSFYITLSDEKLSMMNADLIFLAAQDKDGKADPAIVKNPVYDSVAAVKAGHVAYWPGPALINTNTPGGQFSSALSIGGPLGIRYALPQLVTMLQKGLTA